MARDEHNKAAEHHENAAKSHRAAAEHHGKGDHAKGKEQRAFNKRPATFAECSPTQRTSAYQESAAKVSIEARLASGLYFPSREPALLLQRFVQLANELSDIVCQRAADL